MKRGGKILLCVLSGLGVATTMQAITDRSNPYGSIVGRNVFSLKPPPRPEEPPPPPAPKITLQGINSILGLRQVLFKIAPFKPGEKEKSYILSEGQSQDDIEVLAIDEIEGTVKFNNHGSVQTLVMSRDAGKPTAVSATAHRVIYKLMPRTDANAQKPKQPAMTVGEQVIIIEVERERTKAQVEAGELPPLPPTELTPAGSK